MSRAAVVLIAVAMLAPPSATAEDKHVAKIGDLRIVHVWTRAVADAKRPADVFMEVENGGVADRLVSAEAPIAAKATVVGLGAKAGAAAAPIGPAEIPERGKLILDPSGVAVRLEGLKRPLKSGGDFELKLVFEKAGTVTVTGEVMPANAKSHGHAGHRH